MERETAWALVQEFALSDVILNGAQRSEESKASGSKATSL